MDTFKGDIQVQERKKEREIYWKKKENSHPKNLDDKKIGPRL